MALALVRALFRLHFAKECAPAPPLKRLDESGTDTAKCGMSRFHHLILEIPMSSPTEVLTLCGRPEQALGKWSLPSFRLELHIDSSSKWLCSLTSHPSREPNAARITHAGLQNVRPGEGRTYSNPTVKPAPPIQ